MHSMHTNRKYDHHIAIFEKKSEASGTYVDWTKLGSIMSNILNPIIDFCIGYPFNEYMYADC